MRYYGANATRFLAEITHLQFKTLAPVRGPRPGPEVALPGIEEGSARFNL